MMGERRLTAGAVLGERFFQEIEEPVKREIRYLDKLIDELAKGKVLERILRQRAC